PEWFIRFNREPQPSRLRNGVGTPYAADIRLPAHVQEVTGMPPVAPPDVRIRGTEMTDGYHHLIGLPPGAASWWGGEGIRVALVLEMKRPEQDSPAFRALAGSRAPLSELLSSPKNSVTEACVADLFNDHAHVVSRGE